MQQQGDLHEWGPHQRVTSPDPALLALQDLPEDEWDLDQICGGVWTIFPHISIAGGNFSRPGGAAVPGHDARHVADDPQLLRRGRAVDEEQRAQAMEQADFVERVVRDEDYATGFGLQRALSSGAKRSIFFGRNEGGGQHFHHTLDQLLAAGAATSRPPSA